MRVIDDRFVCSASLLEDACYPPDVAQLPRPFAKPGHGAGRRLVGVPSRTKRSARTRGLVIKRRTFVSARGLGWLIAAHGGWSQQTKSPYRIALVEAGTASVNPHFIDAFLVGLREFARAGGLIAYATSVTELFRRAAIYVDKILRGAKPRDLPVEQPTKFELVIHFKAAKALGIKVPKDMLMCADEVIR